MKKILVEGHRGYAAKYPENTLISFEAAIDLGVDAIEFDVWLSAEKVPVIIHDGNCKRTKKTELNLWVWFCLFLLSCRILEPLAY